MYYRWEIVVDLNTNYVGQKTFNIIAKTAVEAIYALRCGTAIEVTRKEQVNLA